MHDRTNRTPHFSEQSSFVEEILSQYSPALARSATQILAPRNIDTFQIFETFEQALQLSKRKTISNEDKKTIRFLTETLAPKLIFRLISAINEALIEHKRLSIFKQTITVVGHDARFKTPFTNKPLRKSEKPHGNKNQN
jgi:hypothetical protein